MSKRTFYSSKFAIFRDPSDSPSMTSSLVLTIRSASWSSIRQMDRHESVRDPDGTSAIDPDRSDLNRVTIGPATQGEALDELFASGVQRPAKQAEAPFLQIVASASPEFFRPDDPGARGTWDAKRLSMFERQTMSWLRKEFGRDLVHVSLHLDEDTPHFHILVAPTYDKRPRRPGRRKKNETEEEFAARKLAAEEGQTVRTVGRSSNASISAKGSYERMRRSYASKLELIGIGYGNPRAPDAPAPKTTAAWVKEEGNRLADDRRQLAQDRDEVIAQAKAAGFDQGRAEGFEAGRAEGRAEIAEELAGLRAVVENLRRGAMRTMEKVRAAFVGPKADKLVGQLEAVEAEADFVSGQIDKASATEDLAEDRRPGL